MSGLRVKAAMTEDPLTGILLDGRYRIIKHLGGGSFGKTYLAEDIKLIKKPICLVKQLKPTRNDPSTMTLARRLFELEAKKLEELRDHPQIPVILAYFEENQDFYLVQEFIEGHTLSREIIPDKKLSESYVIALLHSILEPLSYLHKNNVIHRDIKPDNIMRREKDGKIFLIDFGAVKEIPVTEVNSKGISKATIVIGTTGYMPSEQFNGHPKYSSDLYALGMTAIYALTGIPPKKLPVDTKTLEVQWRHEATVEPLLANFLSKMISYDYRYRPKNATEAIENLKEIERSVYKRHHSEEEAPTLPPTLLIKPSSSNNLTDQLTLEWFDSKGEKKNQIIYDNQQTKNQKTFRIGRDSNKCDLVLDFEITVSREHIEIFFNPETKSFYLRSLRNNNPPEIDGKIITTEEVSLKAGNTIKLGQLIIKVIEIAQKPLPNQVSTSTSSPQPSPQAVLPTQKISLEEEKLKKPKWKLW